MLINTSFDFRTDTPVRKDPDAFSPTLCWYHKLLWSKVLPSGVPFNLEVCSRHGNYALHHRSELGEFYLTSDAIINSYTSWERLRHITGLLPEEENEAFRTVEFNIGSRLVFPGNQIDGKQTINGARGRHGMIGDRFDLTLECIRRHYIGQYSPLEDTLKRYGDFFLLFDDFRRYVEFFMLQDLVRDDYSAVKFFVRFDGFGTSPLPKNVDTYREYRRRSIEFAEARNRRIHQYAVFLGTNAISEMQTPRKAGVSTQKIPNAVVEAAIEGAALAPAPLDARTGMTQAQALYGADANVRCISHNLKGQPYGWVGGALMLNKTAPANGVIGASWKVQVDPRITIEATVGGYMVKDTLHIPEGQKALSLKEARVIADAWLQARPEAQGKAGI
jgi:hypothetical protein